MRWAFRLEYDGAGFVGWQRQDNGVSIQEVFESALQRLEGAPVASIVAGRTDAGVHAAGQVAHADLTRDIDPDRLREALNFHLKPHRVAILACAAVEPGWNARFDAVARAYEYRILNRRPRPALEEGRVWHVPAPLDLDAMREAAAYLLGRHDFSSFRAASCQAKSPVRTLDVLDVHHHGEIVLLRAKARSFLHHQVRNLAGTLRDVGAGRIAPGAIPAILDARDRAQAGATAPSCGLTLVSVRYVPDPFSAASQASWA